MNRVVNQSTEACGMVLHSTLPPDDDIARELPGGDEALYRACAAHLTGDATLLDAASHTSRHVEQRLAAAMKTLRNAGATEPPALSDSLRRAILRSLIDDVEKGQGRVFKSAFDEVRSARCAQSRSSAALPFSAENQ